MGTSESARNSYPAHIHTYTCSDIFFATTPALPKMLPSANAERKRNKGAKKYNNNNNIASNYKGSVFACVCVVSSAEQQRGSINARSHTTVHVLKGTRSHTSIADENEIS